MKQKKMKTLITRSESRTALRREQEMRKAAKAYTANYLLEGVFSYTLRRVLTNPTPGMFAISQNSFMPDFICFKLLLLHCSWFI
ncbi:hypothetical protein T4C_6670 [Trichinella pseudospiralis]|uniref:Uncharacterized protein n=1 Tax=Trichinella pseudospiralis TaxID=6337 RepID=A0A0V1K405_TRIPS|nr:hypothetical protein T4C_6670 [Trichinella pseudospiralis]